MSYFCARKNRPKWLAVASLSVTLYATSLVILHFIYGPGDDAYALTDEYGIYENDNASMINLNDQKIMCRKNCK